jgi:hypothetical protein
MLVPVRQRARPILIAHQQIPTFRHHSNPCYRQIAQLLTKCPQASSMSWSDCEEQLVIIASAER